jgi:putative FmdB family regulatory protein
MPLYDYHCPACKANAEAFEAISTRDEHDCAVCGTRSERQISACGFRADVFDWSSENGRKGRYIGQLQRKTIGKARDGDAYCKNRKEIFEKCKKAGLGYETVY